MLGFWKEEAPVEGNPLLFTIKRRVFRPGGDTPLDPPERASFVLLNAEIFTMSSDLQKNEVFCRSDYIHSISGTMYLYQKYGC